MPWFEKMRNGEDDAQDDANTSDDNISNSKKRILAAHDGPG